MNKVTMSDISANIVGEYFFTASEAVDDAPEQLQLLTFCVLLLRNGFTVTGESACADPANFNKQTGRDIARQNAVAKIWPLMGYELKSKLSSI